MTIKYFDFKILFMYYKMEKFTITNNGDGTSTFNVTTYEQLESLIPQRYLSEIWNVETYTPQIYFTINSSQNHIFRRLLIARGYREETFPSQYPPVSRSQNLPLPPFPVYSPRYTPQPKIADILPMHK